MVNRETSPEAVYLQRLEEHLNMAKALSSLQPQVVTLSLALAQALAKGGKLLLFGNGGSAADCQHIAAELVNRFMLERPALAGLALTTDSSNLTAISNDYAYDWIFARQIEALGRAGDVALGISTSGNSKNVIEGLKVARAQGLITFAFTGEGGGKIGAEGLADHLIAIPSRDTARIQEGHIFVGHLMCELLERALAPNAQASLPVGSTDAPHKPVSTAESASTAPAAVIPAAVAPAAVTPAAAPVEKPAYFVHPSSVVDEGCTIGAGTKIWYFNHVQGGSRIGRDCILGQNINIDKDAIVGDRVKIQNNVSVYKGVVVEDDAFLGPSMVFTNVINPRSHVNRKNEFLATRVGKGSSIGANATIVCGHDIGEYAFIGAGAVVTKNVPPYALITGNPGRVRGWVCRCAVKLSFKPDSDGSEGATCSACGRQYIKWGDRVSPVETV